MRVVGYTVQLVAFGCVALSPACGETAKSEPDDAGDTLAPPIDLSRPVADADPPPTCEFGLVGGACAPEPPRGTPDESCPSGERVGFESFDGGVCLPEQPRATPAADCPSGEYLAVDGMAEPGICTPEPPRLGDWACPTGWRSEPMLQDEAGTAAPFTEFATGQNCRPPAADLATEACPPGEYLVPTSSACEPVPSTCPAGTATSATRWPTCCSATARPMRRRG